MNGSVSGNIATAAAGSGTLILPGGTIYTGVLQVKMSLTAVASFIFGTIKANIKAIDYTYYDVANKFPLLTVSYMNSSGAYTANSVAIKVNSSIVGGQEAENVSTFNLFPNPARDYFSIGLQNNDDAITKVEVLNLLGDQVMFLDLGSNTSLSERISISDLPQGIYSVKVHAGDRVSTRKLIKQ
jgi:hypothetical protein